MPAPFSYFLRAPWARRWASSWALAAGVIAREAKQLKKIATNSLKLLLNYK